MERLHLINHNQQSRIEHHYLSLTKHHQNALDLRFQMYGLYGVSGRYSRTVQYSSQLERESHVSVKTITSLSHSAIVAYTLLSLLFKALTFWYAIITP